MIAAGRTESKIGVVLVPSTSSAPNDLSDIGRRPVLLPGCFAIVSDKVQRGNHPLNAPTVL